MALPDRDDMRNSTSGEGADPTTGLDEDAFNQFMDEHRARCLWFVRPDYYPTTDADRHRILEAIERHGTVAAFARARTFKACLSPSSSGTSAT